MQKIATNENFKELVVEIAHKELVQKPRYVADCWLDVLHLLKPHIMSTDGLFQMYESLHPSTQKVCKLIKADPKTPVENESVGYLKRWIKGLDANGLAKFLRISTGSDVILCEAIEIAFSSLTGTSRRPIFHTCGAVIELPITYDNFCDFREEWCSIMSQPDIEMGLV